MLPAGLEQEFNLGRIAFGRFPTVRVLSSVEIRWLIHAEPESPSDVSLQGKS